MSRFNVRLFRAAGAPSSQTTVARNSRAVARGDGVSPPGSYRLTVTVKKPDSAAVGRPSRSNRSTHSDNPGSV